MIKHTILRNGDLIFLANCVVLDDKLTAGFGFFEGGCPAVIPLRTNADQLIGRFILPDEAKDCAHPVAMGDYGSPIELKRYEEDPI